MNYHEIIKHLFLGNTIPTREFFHTIVNCTHEIPFSNFCNIRIRIPVNDDIDDCSKFIQILSQTNVLQKIYNCISSGKNVLVHCSGDYENQRSFTIIVCYLIKYYRFTPIQAVNYIFESGDISFENIRFMKAIIAYYYICKRKTI
jgi:hypothetical protein